MGCESAFTDPFQAYWVDIPVCNNWADIGLPEVYNDPDLASFNGADDAGRRPPTTRTSSSRRSGCSPPTTPPTGHSTASSTVPSAAPGRPPPCTSTTWPTEVWSFTGGPPRPTDADVGQAGGGHRPALLQPDPAAGECSATSESLSVRQRRARGERAGRGDAEHSRSVTTRSGNLRTSVGYIVRLVVQPDRWRNLSVLGRQEGWFL